MRMRSLAGVAALAACSFALLGAAPAAAADDSPEPKHRKICVYAHKNFNGDKACYKVGNHNLGDLNDRATSVENYTGTTLCLFQHANRKGYQLALGGDNYLRDLTKDTAPDGNSWSDRISSIGKCR